MFPRHDGVLLGGSHDRGGWDMSVDPLVGVRGSPATGDLFWTPSGLQNGMPGRSCVCKSLRNLVGPPRFELGTSCTPSKRASQAAPRPEPSYYTPLNPTYREPPAFRSLRARRLFAPQRPRPRDTWRARRPSVPSSPASARHENTLRDSRDELRSACETRASPHRN